MNEEQGIPMDDSHEEPVAQGLPENTVPPAPVHQEAVPPVPPAPTYQEAPPASPIPPAPTYQEAPAVPPVPPAPTYQEAPPASPIPPAPPAVPPYQEAPAIPPAPPAVPPYQEAPAVPPAAPPSPPYQEAPAVPPAAPPSPPYQEAPAVPPAAPPSPPYQEAPAAPSLPPYQEPPLTGAPPAPQATPPYQETLSLTPPPVPQAPTIPQSAQEAETVPAPEVPFNIPQAPPAPPFVSDEEEIPSVSQPVYEDTPSPAFQDYHTEPAGITDTFQSAPEAPADTAQPVDGYSPPQPVPPNSDGIPPADHTPAVAEEDSEGFSAAYLGPPPIVGSAMPEVATNNSGNLPQAEDILLSISTISPDQEVEMRASQAITNIRGEAALSAPSKKSKLKTSPLPFDMLIPGTPLIGTIYSPSGGVGKSSTAMNLAVYIAAIGAEMARKKSRETGEDVDPPRVLVFDGDIVQGSLALRLTGDLEPSIYTLQTYIDDRKAEGYEEEQAWPQVYEDAPPGEKAMRDFIMYPDEIPNVNVLASPEDPDLFYDFGSGDYQKILRMLGKFYDVIIIDSGTDVVLESQRSWLAHANQVFLVTTPELDRLYNTSRAALYIARSRPHPRDSRPDAPNMPPLATSDKLSVVMTRADVDSGLDVNQVVNDLFPWISERQKFFIPDVNKEMLRANNQGEFLSVSNPQYAEKIAELANHLFARYADMKQKRALPGQK